MAPARTRAASSAPGSDGRPDRLLGNSRAIQRAQEQINVAARGRFPVWIQGEPGSDRALIGHLIHQHSEWATGSFTAVDAAIVPAQLIGRDLFGSLEAAAGPGSENPLLKQRGSTVLIENVESLPKEVQQTLATALERGEVRIGSADGYPLEARVLASSSHPLDALTGEGRLSQELAERLRLLEIALPPLRDRREDILPMAAFELSARIAEVEHETGHPCPVRAFSQDALARLRAHNWPGDERELREQVRAAVSLCRSSELAPEDLMLNWESSTQVPSFRDAKRAFEQEYVTRVLRLCGGNISQAARIAKKDRKDFYDVMRRNGINPADFRNS